MVSKNRRTRKNRNKKNGGGLFDFAGVGTGPNAMCKKNEK